ASINNNVLPVTTRIFSSDFKRTRETAEIVYQHLACEQPVSFEECLRERYFGQLELGPDTRYPDIWLFDKQDPGHREQGVESVNSVLRRASTVVHQCEKKFKTEIVLLIAHGDILQILQTAFSGIPASCHRELRHLETAELRELTVDLKSINPSE
ncbi:MAG: histidine phosphatase family protein, partial [Gammaproteobacteria bacterium]|nr:histidine phosphatase family protein [Gammaproteobacteria bacterium]